MSDVVTVALIGAIGGAVPGIVAAVIGIVNRSKLAEVSVKVNGQTEKLVAVEKQLSFREGHTDGVLAERIRSGSHPIAQE